MIALGLDIGSNSVGSAWADTEAQRIHTATSIFPAGVEEKDDKRGAPLNQARRQTRQQRRNIARRQKRKHRLIRFLIEQDLLPRDPAALQLLLDAEPWALRRKALDEAISPHQFGRICLHMAQRRGAVGVTTDPDDPEEGKVKEGMDRLNAALRERNARTVGELMALLMAERTQTANGKTWQEPVRNRQYRMPEDRMLFAGRETVRDEFLRIVAAQRGFKGNPLAERLTGELIATLDDTTGSNTWRHRGLLFGQRRTYWDTGALGRCVLEPTERCAPIADRHASYYRVIESVNNIKIERDGRDMRPLTADERATVINKLRGPLFKKVKGELEPKASASISDIKEALGVKPRDPLVRLNIEADENREINTDWFHREIVHGAFGEALWNELTDEKKESVNRAILGFDPDNPVHVEKLRKGAGAWWGLDDDAAGTLIAAWSRRPKLEKRLKLSRRAILNLLPIMETFDAQNNRWPTQQEARKKYGATLNEAHARQRYITGAPGLTAADRYYMKLDKHRVAQGIGALPPAPMLPNPVVRKAIHEVRRHVTAWMRKFGRKPDRVIIEMARSARESEKKCNEALARNRFREKIRKDIIEEVLPRAFGAARAAKLTLNQQRSAVDRVLLARQQNCVCPYCGRDGLTDVTAAEGGSVEIDHIAPYSRTGDNGMNNKVLVHTECNRGKGNQTPKEWWGRDFDERCKFAAKLFKGTGVIKGQYFDRRDCDRKWQNFTREINEGKEWKGSQLTDTAYAARQVAAYLADALYDGRGLPERGDGEGEQKIFFTMGRYTSTLRKDWQLYETLIPPVALGNEGGLTAEQQLVLAEKDRGDHRQHAIDAAVIALTDAGTVRDLATESKRAAEFWEKTRQKQSRSPVAVPWGDITSFRKALLSSIYPRLDGADNAPPGGNGNGRLIVAHRPVKRRLIGAFHEETHYGPVVGPLPSHRTEDIQTLFTNRIGVSRLTPNHLRVPEGWDALSARLADAGINESQKKQLRKELAALRDPSPGKSGIVRDRALRDRLRKCLRNKGLDPDRFSANDIKALVAGGNLTMSSGVPIKGVVLLRVNSDPVRIPRRRLDPLTGQKQPVLDKRDAGAPTQRTDRIYIGGNNHHIAIRENRKTGKWTAEVVSMYEASRRVRIEKRGAVDRSDTDASTFVMSLAEGEMIYARRADRPDEPPDYYVVCKLDKPARIHFAPHWDARKASEQDRWDVAPANLKDCGPEAGSPPQKVHVSPLGDVTPLMRN